MATNYTLDNLIADIKKNTYTPKTDAELQAEANARYQSAYDQKRLDAQQAYDTSEQAIDRQLSSLGATYAKQKEESTKQYNQVRSQADRQALSRGMQLSSYNNATQSNIAIAGNKAQQGITDAENTARTGLEDQKTLQARQLADLLKQYSASQTADALSYLDQLKSQDYDRSTAATNQQNSLAAQLYQFANQEAQQNIANDLNRAKLNEDIRQFDTLHPTTTKNNNNRNDKDNDKGNNPGPTNRDLDLLLGSPPYNQKTLDSWAKSSTTPILPFSPLYKSTTSALNALLTKTKKK
jgi:hypothetical protein